MNVEDLNVIFKEMEFLVKTVKEKKQMVLTKIME